MKKTMRRIGNGAEITAFRLAVQARVVQRAFYAETTALRSGTT